MKIDFYTRDVYGKPYRYVADQKIARSLFTLTGKKTVGDDEMKALETLGFTFEHVLPPTAE